MPDARPRRLTPRVAAMLGSAGVLAVALSGCAGAPAPTPAPTPPASAHPIFASDEEALAAAEAAYESFLSTSVAVTNDGGVNADRLKDVATGQALEDEAAAAARFLEEGWRTSGSIGFRVSHVQSVSVPQGDEAMVSIYVCDDLRNLDMVDGAGASLVVEGRVVDVPYTVVVTGRDSLRLKVVEKALWTRDNFCLS